MGAGRQLMSSVDAAWLHMHRAGNPMVIVGVMMFEGRLDLARVRRAVAGRFACHPRFRQRPGQELGLPAWLDCEFEVDAHVVPAALPEPCGQRELEDLAGRLATEPLDPARPLWQFHVIERYGAGSALVMRVHHCYADGIALVRVVLAMTAADRAGSLRVRPPPDARPARRGRDGHADGALERLLGEALASGSRWLGGRLGRGVARGLDLARHPDQLNALARHALGMAGEAARVLALPDERVPPLQKPLGRRRKVAWAEPLPLADVKGAARALGVSVNDVLMATVAGALGAWLRERGVDTAGLTLRAAVPVNLRPDDAPLELGNQFGLVFLDLPVGLEHPLERTYAVHAAMAQLKRSYQPVMMLGLLAALGVLPGTVENAAIDALGAKVSAVVSNVPGPAEPRYLAGRRITQQVFWVPQSGGVGVGVSVLSYAGQVQFGLVADARRIPDPRAVVRRFAAQFEQLLLAVLMGPAPPPGDAARARPRRRPARRRRLGGKA